MEMPATGVNAPKVATVDARVATSMLSTFMTLSVTNIVRPSAVSFSAATFTVVSPATCTGAPNASELVARVAAKILVPEPFGAANEIVSRSDVNQPDFSSEAVSMPGTCDGVPNGFVTSQAGLPPSVAASFVVCGASDLVAGTLPHAARNSN